MATPSEKLGGSLEALAALQKAGRTAVLSKDLARSDRERLLKNGFLKEVMKGWYIAVRPDETDGESTAWYASYWGFCADYLNERFGDNWCLSPEQSLLIHAGDWTVLKQLLVRAKGGGNKPTDFVHGTSVIDTNVAPPDKKDRAVINGLQLYAIEPALIAASPNFFISYPTEARAVLAIFRNGPGLIGRLLDGGHSVVAGRLAAAFRNIGRDALADEITKAMRAADFDVREKDPFEREIKMPGAGQVASPYVHRMRLLWQEMREDIPKNFPVTGRPNDIKAYLKEVDDIYATDAYNSLSIEGYKVSAELIERVRSGDWNPDQIKADKEHRDALAARGYWQAFQSVKKSVRRVLENENPGKVAGEDHGEWYRQLFTPSVTAGLLKPSDLAGYRNGPVYIRNSMHVPPNSDAVLDMMPLLFELLAEESEPSVRIVLGHFMFVYIHPYFDGNGRTGRFLMNVMMASGGYSWTVIPVERRTEYMEALEQASVHRNIAPFAKFLASLIME
jgi:Fic/DOC family